MDHGRSRRSRCVVGLSRVLIVPTICCPLGWRSRHRCSNRLHREQSPDFFYGAWAEAIAHCQAKTVGGQAGWRLPTIKELASLIDSSQKDPALPSGHPFGNIKSSIYWSSTPSETDDIVAWHVSFFTGEVVTDQKSQTRRAWCMLDRHEPPSP
jgi:hypothetical protein